MDTSTIKISEQDLAFFNKYKWHISKTKDGHRYIKRAVWLAGKGRGTSAFFHREVMNCPKGMYVDHINGDTLDNRRENLRICTMRGNARNMSSHKDSTCEFKGVSWDSSRNRWVAQIWDGKRQRHLGRHRDKLSAARRYDSAAKEVFGEYAKLNNI